MPNPNEPNPEHIFKLISGFQHSAAIKGAIDLDLFTALSGRSMTAATLAGAIDASERGVRILCDYLTIDGLLQKEGATYRSSPDAAAFLDKNSPFYLGSVSKFMMGPAMLDSYADIASVVRKGGTLLPGQGSVEPENGMWVDFARAMVPLMMPAAEFIAELVTRDLDEDRPLKVLDVAAGHGVFGISIAAEHSAAEVVALDWPAVLEVATENAQKHGVAERHTRLPGNAFDVEFGAGYDLVLLTNFLHHYDVATCTGLLRKAHAALNEGGRAVTLEFVPNEDRVTPPDQASFALTMLASTTAGDAYTFKQLESMAADAGFAGSEFHRIEKVPQSVVVSTK